MTTIILKPNIEFNFTTLFKENPILIKNIPYRFKIIEQNSDLKFILKLMTGMMEVPIIKGLKPFDMKLDNDDR